MVNDLAGRIRQSLLTIFALAERIADKIVDQPADEVLVWTGITRDPLRHGHELPIR